MSALSQFHARALSRAVGVAGDAFAFGAAQFVGVRGKLRPDDPRLPGAGDRAFLLTVEASGLPVPRPSTGAILSSGAETFRLVRPVDLQPDGSAQLVLVPHLAA